MLLYASDCRRMTKDGLDNLLRKTIEGACNDGYFRISVYIDHPLYDFVKSNEERLIKQGFHVREEEGLVYGQDRIIIDWEEE